MVLIDIYIYIYTIDGSVQHNYRNKSYVGMCRYLCVDIDKLVCELKVGRVERERESGI